jgi:ABC-type dipeptide/oligopeptide/nickel transport system permease subunit
MRAHPDSRGRWPGRRPLGLGFWAGAGILVFYAAVALSALVVFRGSLGYLTLNLSWFAPPPLGPSWSHPFGIDPGFGVDLFQAMWKATPWDLGIVAGILAIDIVFGLVLGTAAGMREGGVLDSVVTFVSDSLSAIPTFLLVVIVFAGLAVVAPAEAGIPVFIVVFGFVLWPTIARTVRERARAVAHEPFVEAARASGATPGQVLVRHILPNSVGPVLAQLPLDVAPIFFVLSVLPWFGNCGINFPHERTPPFLPVPALPAFSPLPSAMFPEWGLLLGINTCYAFTIPGGFNFWWLYLFPLLAIVLLGVAIGLVCDGVERWRQFER